jgi:hypothetical protein
MAESMAEQNHFSPVRRHVPAPSSTAAVGAEQPVQPGPQRRITGYGSGSCGPVCTKRVIAASLPAPVTGE